MIFLSEADFLVVIKQAHIDDLKDDEPTVLEDSEEAAIGEMTGYLNIRHDSTLCFDPDNKIPIIVQKLVDIALYHAHARCMPDQIPKLRVTRYQDAINWLEKLSSGFIDPNIPKRTDGTPTPIRYGSSQDKTSHHF